jgi:flagellar biosynthesis protein FlhF
MNMKRFTARSPRDALAQVRATFGPDAVVLSTRPCAEGVEVLAMAPEGVADIERAASRAPLAPVPVMPTPESFGAAREPVRVEQVLSDNSSVGVTCRKCK